MRKSSFYTLCNRTGNPRAYLVEGYTDGMFYYYRSGSVWFAVHGMTGMSVCKAYTRRDAATQAHDPALLAKVDAVMLREGGRLRQRFDDLRAEAFREEVCA